MHWLIQPDNPHPIEATQLPGALLYGYSVYTSFRLPLSDEWLSRHLQRLHDDAARLGIPCSWRQASLPMLRTALDSLSLPEPVAYRITVLPNIQEFNQLFSRHPALVSESSVSLLSARPLPDRQSTGLSLTSRRYERPLAGVKHSSLTESFYLKRAARQAGFDDLLFLNADDVISEAVTTNFFGVSLAQNTIFTPDPKRDGCLDGITRQQILKIASQQGMRLEVKPIRPALLHDFDGAFLTNAVLGIQRVDAIDDHAFLWPNTAQQWLNNLTSLLEAEQRGVSQYPLPGDTF